MSDKDLIERFQKGDMEALGVLYYKYKERIVFYIRGQTKSMEVAEDLLHETFIKVMRYPDSYNGKYNICSWFLFIAKQVVITHYIRINRKKRKGVNIPISYDLQSDQETPEQLLESKMEVSKIRRKIKNLTPALRETINLYSKGYQYDEISKLLNIPMGTVKIRIHRARQSL